MIAIATMTACKNGLKHISVSRTYLFPTVDLKEAEVLWDMIDTVPYDEMNDYQKNLISMCEDNHVLGHFYSPSCSWYCGGIIDTVVSSSCIEACGNDTFEGKNTHDWNICSAWIAGGNNGGKGETLTYTFPGNCPRITTVCILNGFARDTTHWQDYSRVKSLKIYYDGKPYAILELQDTRDEQDFDVGILGYRDVEHPADWTLKFEILEVYPGRKHNNAAITELFFDGIDVH